MYDIVQNKVSLTKKSPTFYDKTLLREHYMKMKNFIY